LSTYHLSGLQQLVAEQKVAGNACSTSDGVTENTERVVNALGDGVHRLTVVEVQTNNIALVILVLKRGNYEAHC
jgi:hypothetical protein